ncbi:GNAT family N-acetyltransferase, partial [Halobellus sp. Atlit-31R]
MSEELAMIIRRLDARAIREVRTQLATLLLDAVADGFSLGFLAGLDDQQLDAYWSGVEADVALGSRVLLAAERNGLLVGSVQLDLCQKPNGSNRAELQKMLVHCT